MSRAMPISCSRRWRSRSRSTRRALSKNAGGVGGEGVEDLAIEFGESRGPARVQIENAEKVAALDVDHRLIGVGARHGVQRNDHHGAQALRDDALRGLQIHVGLREIFGDHRGLSAQRELNGGLTRRETFGRQTHAAAAPRQTNFQHSLVVGFQEQAAVRVGDGNGVIQHVPENGVERQLGVQQRGGFQKQIQLAQTAASPVPNW